MNRKAEVFLNGNLVGELCRNTTGYVFRYTEFGKLVGIVEKRARKIITDISAARHEPRVKEMVGKSFLNRENKESYHNLYQDKLKRFRYSFLKQIGGQCLGRNDFQPCLTVHNHARP